MYSFSMWQGKTFLRLCGYITVIFCSSTFFFWYFNYLKMKFLFNKATCLFPYCYNLKVCGCKHLISKWWLCFVKLWSMWGGRCGWSRRVTVESLGEVPPCPTSSQSCFLSVTAKLETTPYPLQYALGTKWCITPAMMDYNLSNMSPNKYLVPQIASVKN